MNNSNLEFRKIPSLDFLYEVNENGTIVRNVKSKRQCRIKLEMHHSDRGYYAVFVRHARPGRCRTQRAMVHALVAECWLGPRPDGLEIDHIDRNTHNNSYANLRYVTRGEQMRNRDHSRIAATGTENLRRACELRKKPVLLSHGGSSRLFASYAAAARFLSEETGVGFDYMRMRLRQHRASIRGYDVVYLNAETIHGSSTEQEIVHESDLSGDYKTAFNKGKQAEVEARVKHAGLEAEVK